MHVKDDPEDYSMDDFEIAHVAKLHSTILTALTELRTDGLFGGDDSFVVIWIPDSGHEIMYQSAKALNAATVYKTFMEEFG